MANLIVGDQDCKFTDIVAVMMTSASAAHIKTNWRALLHALDLADLLDDMNRALNLQITDHWTIFTKILTTWRAKNGINATFAALITNFSVKCQWNDLSDSLQEKFGSVPVPVSANGRSEDVEKQVKRQKEFITGNMDELIANCFCTVTLLVALQAKKILAQDEVDDIQTNRTRQGQNFRLFQILESKLNPKDLDMYKTIVEVFNNARQNGVSYTLEKFYTQ